MALTAALMASTFVGSAIATRLAKKRVKREVYVATHLRVLPLSER